MKRLIKWVLILTAGFIGIALLALLVVPFFVDIQKYRPQIEKQISAAIGREVRMGEDISLSLFPWAGIGITDINVGNLPGFREKEFVSAGDFEIRFKLFPLLFQEVEVSRFVLKDPKIVLEKNRQGRGNWQKPAGAPHREKPSEPEMSADMLLRSLHVEEFAVENGTIVYIDHAGDHREEIRAINLTLTDITLDKPVAMEASASYSGLPVSLKGSFGPLEDPEGGRDIPLDIQIKALTQVDVGVKGKVINTDQAPGVDFTIAVAPFSPRKLAGAFGQGDRIKTRDPDVLNRFSLGFKINGDSRALVVSDGICELDDIKTLFTVKTSHFDKPNIEFDVAVNALDLDRYLAPPATSPRNAGDASPASTGKAPDFAPMRRMMVDGKLKIDQVKVYDATAENLSVIVFGRGGQIEIAPVSMTLYEGRLDGRVLLDFRRDILQSVMAISGVGIQVNPLMKNLFKKDFLEGTVKNSMEVGFSGNTPDEIRHTLNGKGHFLFLDGAIKGIDLTEMAQNIKSAFGMQPQGGGREPRTDFSELSLPFVIETGVVKTDQCTLKSPVLRITASGKADLVRETLDVLVSPKLVSTIKGQGDEQERTGVTVPIRVAGTFQKPTFRPELRGIIQEALDSQGKTILGFPIDALGKKPAPAPQDQKPQPETTPSPKEQLKNLFKGLKPPK
jgi:AsmA protein